MRFKSIATRISVLLMPIVVVTIVAFVVFSYAVNNERNNQSFNEKMQESVVAADLEIQLELSRNEAVARHFASYASFMDFAQFDHERHKNVLAEGILGNANTSSGGIWFEPYAFDPDNYAFGPFLYKDDNDDVFYTPQYSDYADFYQEDWYISGKESQGETLWSDVYTDPFSNTTMITATKAFYNPSGHFLGVGTADMNLEDIRAIVDRITIGKTGRAFILGARGEYITFYEANKNANDLMQYDSDPELAALGMELMNNDTGMLSFSRHGTLYRVYYMTMETINWTLVVTIEESEIGSTALASFLATISIPAVGLTLVILGIILIIRYLLAIVRKVNHFADKAVSSGFTQYIDVTEIDEFGHMEQQLNAMIFNMREMHLRLKDSLELAEKASRSKGEFLSRMSHEIRTPMNAIIGMTHIAKTSKDPVRIGECLQKIDNASKHLLALINDILDMSKIEADKLELAPDAFDLRQSLSNFRGMMNVKAEEKQQYFGVHIREDVPACIIGDELRLSQVLTNLVGNAIKFTPQDGSVTVEVQEERQEGEYSILSFRVRDNGIGLTEEQQSRLFRSFEQGDGSITRKYGGTGLGLVISKRIVELMGGHIWVKSNAGEGSEFGFDIKVKRSEDKSGALGKSAPAAKLHQSLKILVVDDSPDAKDYMCHILGGMSHRCDSAADGLSAIDSAARAAEESDPYDIIFMDYMMPGMDGIETTRRIRDITKYGTPVIMVSVYDWKDIRIKAEEAGIDRFMPKPVTPSRVTDCLSDLLAGHSSSHAGKVPQPTGLYDFSKHTILIAEDMEINREITSAFLEKTGIHIDYAHNGAEAVRMFRASPELYDLILMDIQMPELDGFGATQQIRRIQSPKASLIPIIAMTANALSDDVEQCRAAGMNDHIAKPIEPDIFLQKLAHYLP